MGGHGRIDEAGFDQRDANLFVRRKTMRHAFTDPLKACFGRSVNVIRLPTPISRNRPNHNQMTAPLRLKLFRHGLHPDGR